MAIQKTEVLREWPAIGRYRIRLLTNSKKTVSIDVREYVSSESFEGFTRRGVSLSPEDAVQLRGVLDEVITSGVFKNV